MRKTFQELAESIRRLPSNRQKIIAIDGVGGVGKSTFAKYLSAALPDSVVIHGDDFYKGPWNKRLEHTNFTVNPNYDWDRYQNQVLEAIKENRAIEYQIYDWNTNTLGAAVSVPADSVVIVEGGYSTQERFKDCYDFTIFIEAEEATRLEKALIRDGEHMQVFWEEDWVPVERNYLKSENPAARADLVVKGHTLDFTEGHFEVSPHLNPPL